MFSYIINNPNNFLIENEKDYQVIPFGHRCTSSLACKYANIRKISLPFDWNIPLFPNKIKKVLENDFADFIPDVHNGIFLNKYGIELAHFNPNLDNGIEEYKRRINRFNNIIQQPTKKYFVYINEDYLYNSDYRQDTFNDDIFNEMLDLEYFLKEKYKNIDYTILYFNFKHHNIPPNSNIINIVLNTNTYYNDDDCNSPYDIFRNYCGEILAELFNTNLDVLEVNDDLGYDDNPLL